MAGVSSSSHPLLECENFIKYYSVSGKISLGKGKLSNWLDIPLKYWSHVFCVKKNYNIGCMTSGDPRGILVQDLGLKSHWALKSIVLMIL